MADKPGSVSPHVLRILISRGRDIKAEAAGIPAILAVILIVILVAMIVV